MTSKFEICIAYQRILKNMPPSLAAILAMTELVENSSAGTMSELVKALNEGAQELGEKVANPISLNAGCELFIAFVTLSTHEADSFSDLKTELIKQGQRYALEAVNYCDTIAELANGFVKDGSVILTHSHSRVVMRALLHAHQRKRISVYVTEARPRGLGMKTYELLTAAGIPCTVVLDSAVAYVMDKVDFVLVGSEAVVESGGLINAVSSNQIAIIAKYANKPFYALAESFKFHRLFPLSQYDLPTNNPNLLSFPRLSHKIPMITARPSISTLKDPSLSNKSGSESYAPGAWPPRSMTPEQIALNPYVDYTRPDLISLVISDVGILTPEGVSQYLVGMFAG